MDAPRKIVMREAGPCEAPYSARRHGKFTRVAAVVSSFEEGKPTGDATVFCCDVCWHAGYRPLQRRRLRRDGSSWTKWVLPGTEGRGVAAPQGTVARQSIRWIPDGDRSVTALAAVPAEAEE